MGSKSSLLSAKLTLLHLLAKLATLEASASSSASQSYPIVELLYISIVAHLVNYLQQEKDTRDGILIMSKRLKSVCVIYHSY